jgi:hypothetical protein
MNDILEDLNRWLDLPIIERRFQQQIGDEPAAGLDLVARAIDEIDIGQQIPPREDQNPQTLYAYHKGEIGRS